MLYKTAKRALTPQLSPRGRSLAFSMRSALNLYLKGAGPGTGRYVTVPGLKVCLGRVGPLPY